MIILWILFVAVIAQPVQAATYYISPSGNNGGTGSVGSPWLTFAYAINPARASCGDTLTLMNGTYGDGTSTGKIDIFNLLCTAGNELTITAQNSRQAKIFDDGHGYAVRLRLSDYIIIDGLYARSTDVEYLAGNDAELGELFYTEGVHHVTLRNNIGRNPNREGNNSVFSNSYYSSGGTIVTSSDILLEDNEAYVFHRHCVTGGSVERMVVRRQYCNPRGGRIPGGITGGTIGYGDSVFSMYPCKDCILENSIGDGTTSGMFLNEVNASFARGVVASGNQVLGSICYKCKNGNGIFINSRNTTGLNNTPQNILVRDVAIVDYNSGSAGIRISDCSGTTGCTIDHVTLLASGAIDGVRGISTDDPASTGVSSASNKVTLTNILSAGFSVAGPSTEYGFNIGGFSTWSGDKIISNGNTVAFSPSLPSNWTNTSTAAHGMGTCKVWVPVGAAGKGAGTGGSDIGATILYRYVNGVLTNVPLWDPVTGAFPHGATDPDGTNAVSGDSLFDIHERLNVNRNGCAFPSGYGSTAPTNPANVFTSDDTEGAHIITIPPGTTALTVMVAVRHDGLNVAHVTSLTSSCGSQDVPGRIAAWFTFAADRSMRVFGLLNPTTGTCTLTPTFDDPARVSGWVMISRTDSNVSGYGDTSAGSGVNSTPSGTVTAGPDDVILGFLGTSKIPTLAAGEDQIMLTDKPHSTKVLRGALSEQSGSHGGHITWILGSSVGWIEQNIVLVTTGGGVGTGSTFRITAYRIDGLLGDPSDPEITLGQLAAQNISAKIGIGGAFRIRTNILVEVASSTPTGFSLYCKKNAGSYARITNSFGGNDLRLYGPGSGANVPVDGTVTTQRFSGPFQGGKVKRDDEAPGILPSTPINTNIELDHLLVTGNAAGNNDQFLCEIRRDDGSRLSGPSDHTVTPAFQTVTPGASMMF